MKSQSLFLQVFSLIISDFRTLFMFKHSLLVCFGAKTQKKTSSIAMWVTMKSMNGKIMKEACERWFKFKQNFLTDRHSNLSVLENQNQIFYKRFRCNGFFFRICFFFFKFLLQSVLPSSLYLVKDTTTTS